MRLTYKCDYIRCVYRFFYLWGHNKEFVVDINLFLFGKPKYQTIDYQGLVYWVILTCTFFTWYLMCYFIHSYWKLFQVTYWPYEAYTFSEFVIIARIMQILKECLVVSVSYGEGIAMRYLQYFYKIIKTVSNHLGVIVLFEIDYCI